MRKVGCHTKTKIVLSLEDYYNAGLSSEEVKNAIEKIRDPFSSCGNLFCERIGFNYNYSIDVWTNNPDKIEYIIDTIHFRLECLLEEKAMVVA
jgi:hypothetical protein